MNSHIRIGIFVLLLVFWWGTWQDAYADRPVPKKGASFQSITYKKSENLDLKLWVYQPTSPMAGLTRPAIVFFHGGGWTGGSPRQLARQALYFSQHGVTSITAEYRLGTTQGKVVYDALSDAKSAVRWVRAHASTLGISPDRIAVGGASAGGHLAVATAVIEDYNDPSDDLTVSAQPNALILLNPVLDLTGRWEGKLGIKLEAVSPLQQLHKPLPPTIIFHGTDDKIAPYDTVVKFVEKASSISNGNVKLIPYKGRQHGFFNRDVVGKDDFSSTLEESFNFIKSLGWL